jgi:tetratricopeptide (TPR) repeat protein
MEVLDLMARIYAQQGKYQEAQKIWLLLIENDPSNLHFISALKMCAIQQKPKYLIFMQQYSWLLILVLFWFIIVLSILISYPPPHSLILIISQFFPGPVRFRA